MLVTRMVWQPIAFLLENTVNISHICIKEGLWHLRMASKQFHHHPSQLFHHLNHALGPLGFPCLGYWQALCLDIKGFQFLALLVAGGYGTPVSLFLLEAFLLNSPSQEAKGVQRSGGSLSAKPSKDCPCPAIIWILNVPQRPWVKGVQPMSPLEADGTFRG